MLTNDERLELERLRAESAAREALPNFDDVAKLAHTNGVIRAWLTRYKGGDLGLNTILYGIILDLAKQ